MTQVTLFSGFHEIAKQTRCCSTDLNFEDTVKSVLRWLGLQRKWLLVIDNLDDVTVVNGYLPEVSPGQHTLITTRNQHVDDIPAEGLEVMSFNVNEAVDLLLIRSAVREVGNTSSGKYEAAEIVKELGCLPLVIEQVAAYILEASKDRFTFLPIYRANRKLHPAPP